MFGMFFDYDERKIGRFEEGDLFVSTVMVTDSDKPFETAIAHPKYNSGELIVVELYDNQYDAESGHEKWVGIITGDDLPDSIQDVSSHVFANLLDIVDEDWRKKEKK